MNWLQISSEKKNIQKRLKVVFVVVVVLVLIRNANLFQTELKAIMFERERERGEVKEEFSSQFA